MDRLSILLTLMSGALITGALVITFFTLGYYNWYVIGGSAIVGWLMAWPAALLVSRRIKARDSEWSRSYRPGEHGIVPDPKHPEI